MIKHDVEKELKKRGYQFIYLNPRYLGTHIKSLEGYEETDRGKNFKILCKYTRHTKFFKRKLISCLLEITNETFHKEYFTLTRKKNEKMC